MLSKQEVEHIAKLARLELSEKEVEKMQRELSSILNYIEKLKEVDVKNVEPMSHSLNIENVTREDLPAETLKDNSENQSKKILDLAPETKEDYLKVKPIF